MQTNKTYLLRAWKGETSMAPSSNISNYYLSFHKHEKLQIFSIHLEVLLALNNAIIGFSSSS
jgi:hypothetical protein